MDNKNDKPPVELPPYHKTRDEIVKITTGSAPIGTPSEAWQDKLKQCHPTERAAAMRDLERHWGICADRQEKLNARWGVPDPAQLKDSPTVTKK